MLLHVQAVAADVFWTVARQRYTSTSHFSSHSLHLIVLFWKKFMFILEFFSIIKNCWGQDWSFCYKVHISVFWNDINKQQSSKRQGISTFPSGCSSKTGQLGKAGSHLKPPKIILHQLVKKLPLDVLLPNPASWEFSSKSISTPNYQVFLKI